MAHARARHVPCAAMCTLVFGLDTLGPGTVLLASDSVQGFRIDSFGSGLLFSLLLTLITSLLFREEDRQRDGDSKN